MADNLESNIAFICFDCFVQYDQNNAIFALYVGDSLSTVDDLGEINLTDTLKALSELNNKNSINPEALSFNFIGQQYEVKIVFYRVGCNSGQLFFINTFDAILLLRKK